MKTFVKTTSILEFETSNPEPYEELCSRLDYNDIWKELAVSLMKYSTLQILELAQQAHRDSKKPSQLLLTRIGQKLGTLEEIFMELYKMGKIVDWSFLLPFVDVQIQKYFRIKLEKIMKQRTKDAELLLLHGGASSSVSEFNPKLHIGLGSGQARMYIEQGEVQSKSLISYPPNMITSSSRKDMESLTSVLLREATQIPIIKYEELKEATGNWSEDNLLGAGGFGQVYKGEWKLLTVAVKRLKETDAKNRELISEMCLNQYRHDNILPLYGYSIEGPVACLVYQYMEGGSLQQRLRLKTKYPPLSWSERLRIAQGVAKGLVYLHTMSDTQPLIHCDIKPANILLDKYCKDPKIGDFGFARKGLIDENTTEVTVNRVRGTRPYMPDEYRHNHVYSTSIDVFSFGVVLLELATGLKAYDEMRDVRLLTDYVKELKAEGHDIANLEDPNVTHSCPDLCIKFINEGLECINTDKNERPSMERVFRDLKDMDEPREECVSS